MGSKFQKQIKFKLVQICSEYAGRVCKARYEKPPANSKPNDYSYITKAVQEASKWKEKQQIKEFVKLNPYDEMKDYVKVCDVDNHLDIPGFKHKVYRDINVEFWRHVIKRSEKCIKAGGR